MIDRAWEKFDSGDYLGAESLYLECLDNVCTSDVEKINAVFMGLIYAEAFLGKYDEARKYGKTLLEAAKCEADKHIAIHQLGMVERMAGNYSEATKLFTEEERIIHASFPNDYLLLAANLYEQGYVAFQTGNLERAEYLMFASLDCAMQTKDDICVGCSFRGMGEILKAVGKAEISKDYFEKAIASFTNAGDMIAVDEIEKMM